VTDQKKTRAESARAAPGGDPPRASEEWRRLLFREDVRPDFKITEDHIQSLLLARRARTALFGNELFSDPAWDLLLELYAARLGERTTSLAHLAQAIDTPPSTLARWVTALNENGLTTSTANSPDPAKIIVSLTDQGLTKLEQLAKRWGAAFVSI
jgi:DNA-binding MarR family transcriptional regulator